MKHQMLLANAGSGKTYALTNRMITLLVIGVEPRKIAALTFTKKAAGEFLDAVFERLAGAALDPEKLSRLRKDTGRPELDAAGCRSVLRLMVDQLGGLCMGTIDSLFARMARAFPFESGLAGDFSMMGDQQLEASREEALAALFQSRARNAESFATFLDLVRQQSRKAGERDIFETLLASVKTLHGKILATPPGVMWGRSAAIWPSGSPVLLAADPVTAADDLSVAITSTHAGLSDDAARAWEEGFDLVRQWKPGTPWPPALEKFVTGKLCKSSIDKKSGDEYVPTGNAAASRVYLNPAVASARAALLRSLIKPEFESLLRRSAALHELMVEFETIYDRIARKQGRLTFSDITDLLAGLVDEPGWRAAAGYRLDAAYDHWLLDEFQDTSRPQWRVLGSFIDEVLQDPGGQRSLFYVGDTKQAIYSWRGGDPRLFFEIFHHYQDAGKPVIDAGELSDSFRSSKEIIDVVNRIFGDIASVQEALELPTATVADWQNAWRPHHVASQNKRLTGYVRWSSVESLPDGDGQDQEILKILDDVRPWSRGLSCAVLKSKNNEVSALAGLLQAHGIPVAAEGKSNPCTDNPLGQAVLAALRVVATPEDRLAGVLLAGFPIGARLLEHGVDIFRANTFRSLAASGYAATIRGWIGETGDEPYLQSRAEAFLKAASEFDAARSSADGIFQFLDFVRGHSITESESPDVVRVMTVHQAKGLTFDMVIVSGLDGRARDSSTDSLFLGPDPARPEWGILLPKKDFAAQDPVLGRARDQLSAESEYAKLCAQYVAVTRPRRGLYIVTNALDKKSSAKNFGRLLQLTLGTCGEPFESGSPDWFQKCTTAEPDKTDEAPVRRALPRPLHGTPRPVSPSAFHPPMASAGKSPSRVVDPAGLGTEVHQLLARIEWIPAPEISGASPEAREMLERFMASSRAAEIFTRPGGRVLLWRERAFDVEIEGVWVSGIFDRVHVVTDGRSRPVNAIIFDFKTDRAPPGEIRDRYAGQLQTYRQAAALLLALPPDSVQALTVPVRLR